MDVEPKPSPEANKLKNEVGSIRFNLKNLLWFTSLIAVGLGTFGPFYSSFLIISTLVLTRIIYLWISHTTPFALEEHFLRDTAVILAIVFTLSLFIPPSIGYRYTTKRYQSRSNTEHIILQILSYDFDHQHWPEPFTTDKNGNRLHSWRTSLLPYIDEQRLYKSLDLDSAWKNKENIKLLRNHTLYDFVSPFSDARDQDQHANYLAIVDSETVWNPDVQVSASEITDDASQTIVLIEVFNREVAWYEPKDLTLDEAVNILTGKDDYEKIREGLFYSERVKGGYLNLRIIGFADGRVKTIGTIKDPQIARALLTRAGGEEIPEDWETVEPEITIGIIIHWGSCISTLLYILLALVPIFKAFHKRKSKLATVT